VTALSRLTAQTDLRNLRQISGSSTAAVLLIVCWAGSTT
jgi:hypothetical protein